MQIIPALLVDSLAELEKQLDLLSPHFTRFQIDIADGLFVPQKTISIEDLVDLQIEEGKQLVFDLDLMVKDTRSALEEIHHLPQQRQNIFIHNLEEYTVESGVGIAIDPEVSVKTLSQDFELQKIPYIQIMSVKPGAQGQDFIKESINKIEQLRSADYRRPIYLDGGINDKTIPLILQGKSLPDFLCIGSYLTTAQDDLEERLAKLESLLKGHTLSEETAE